ncbi:MULTISPECIES: hypothetical protein [Streptosporangium]|uniref:Tetratricopeptide (TPR) repeat protein n=1 Tax=Streptosporangium brasiliense TaxID=47480 RepID=A0ABT9R3Z0_9ACTN|nr:hypothetical protein [Streptosporangium brasiliense]MDP9863952.1 tetratricopeptide (TPR) repeat protein [Streptosporangium brasiliense]
MCATTQLQGFLDRLGWSPEQLAREINHIRGSEGISPKAPYHWLRGAYPRRDIPHAVAKVLSERLGEPIDVSMIWPDRSMPNIGSRMIAPAGAAPDPSAGRSDLTPLIRDSCDSIRLARRVSVTNMDEAALERVNSELVAISVSYFHVPPGSLIHRAVLLRDRIATSLAGPQRPSQKRKLLSLGAKCCALLAWMADDLGDPRAAQNHASAAWELAELADHHEARRWVRLAQARQAFWMGDFMEAAQRTGEALTYRADDGLDAFLTLLRARSWAAIGLEKDAQQAVAGWLDGPRDAPARDGGVFVLQRDRQSYLVGATYLALDQPDRALREFRGFFDHFEALAPGRRFYGVEALTRIDALRAHLRYGEVDEAAGAVGPVFDLRPEKTINMIQIALREALGELRRYPDADARVRDLAERTERFLSRTGPAR